MPDKNWKRRFLEVVIRIFRAIRRSGAAHFLGVPLVMITAVFCAAGRLDMPFAWVYVAVYVLSTAVGHFVTAPDLRQERLRPRTAGKDRLSCWLILPLCIAQWIIAGLDTGRFHWSDSIPLLVRVAGVVGYIASLGLALWAVGVNRFFSSSVRVQDERGHHVVTAGPYQYIRHPGYLAALLYFLCGCLILGSWTTMLPFGGYLLVLLRRTRLEDRFLQEELVGYAEYAAKVRYRLLPGIW